MIELRCDGTLHGRMIDSTHIEVKCGRRKCGHRAGVVVLHVINTITGEVEDTKLYRDPAQKGKVHGTTEPSAAIRSA